jgi:histidinol-phosphatase (PHP family)
VIVDYHMHLRGPGEVDGPIDHSVEAIERYVEVAHERAVDEIGFTEHDYYFVQTRRFWRLPYQLERCAHDLDVYCDAVLEAKRRGLPVKLGLEVDWIGGDTDELAEILEPYPWDYLLGSVHWIDGFAVDSRPGLWDELSVEDVWARYLEELGAAARSGYFDVLAHPDLAKIFGDRVEWERGELVASLDGVALEVSTAGLHKPVGELYPDRGLLETARAAGVGITLASDAHVARNVGRDLELAVRHARDAGYETLTVFEARHGRQEPLG